MELTCEHVERTKEILTKLREPICDKKILKSLDDIIEYIDDNLY